VPALELRHEVVERDVDARVPVAPHRAARAGVAEGGGGRTRSRGDEEPRGGGPAIARESASSLISVS
jgi:hypothetical protein